MIQPGYKRKDAKHLTFGLGIVTLNSIMIGDVSFEDSILDSRDKKPNIPFFSWEL